MSTSRNILLTFLITFTLFSCEEAGSEVIPNKEMEEEGVTIIPGAILQGDFVSASGYTTTGIASVSEEDGERKLKFTNFKTSSGPDLRIYLAEDTKATNFVEITDKVENGNKSYDIPSTVDLSKQKMVLIWCKAFSVNFGYTKLEEPETSN